MEHLKPDNMLPFTPGFFPINVSPFVFEKFVCGGLSTVAIPVSRHNVERLYCSDVVAQNGTAKIVDHIERAVASTPLSDPMISQGHLLRPVLGVSLVCTTPHPTRVFLEIPVTRIYASGLVWSLFDDGISPAWFFFELELPPRRAE